MKLGGNYPVTRPCVNSTVLYCEMCGATKVNPSPGLDPTIDSAEKPSVHPSSASGRTEQRLMSLEIFRSC